MRGLQIIRKVPKAAPPGRAVSVQTDEIEEPQNPPPENDTVSPEVEELRERNQSLELTVRSLEIQLRHIYDPVEKKLCTRDVGVQVKKKGGKVAQRRQAA